MSEDRKKVVYHGIDDIYQDLGDLRSIRNNHGGDEDDVSGGSDGDTTYRGAVLDIHSKSYGTTTSSNNRLYDTSDDNNNNNNNTSFNIDDEIGYRTYSNVVLSDDESSKQPKDLDNDPDNPTTTTSTSTNNNNSYSNSNSSSSSSSRRNNSMYNNNNNKYNNRDNNRRYNNNNSRDRNRDRDSKDRDKNKDSEKPVDAAPNVYMSNRAKMESLTAKERMALIKKYKREQNERKNVKIAYSNTDGSHVLYEEAEKIDYNPEKYDTSKPLVVSSDSEDGSTGEEMSEHEADTAIQGTIDLIGIYLPQDPMEEETIQKILALFQETTDEYRANKRKFLFSKKIKQLFRKAVVKLPTVIDFHVLMLSDNRKRLNSCPLAQKMLLPDLFKVPDIPQPMASNRVGSDDHHQLKSSAVSSFKSVKLPVDLSYSDLVYFKKVSKMLTMEKRVKDKVRLDETRSHRKGKKKRYHSSGEEDDYDNDADTESSNSRHADQDEKDHQLQIHRQKEQQLQLQQLQDSKNNYSNNQDENNTSINSNSSDISMDSTSNSTTNSSSKQQASEQIKDKDNVSSSPPHSSPNDSHSNSNSNSHSHSHSHSNPNSHSHSPKRHHPQDRDSEMEEPAATAERAPTSTAATASVSSVVAMEEEPKQQSEEKIVTMPVGTPIPLSALMKKSTTTAPPSDEKSAPKETNASFQLDSKLLDSLIPNEKDSQLIQQNISKLSIPSNDGVNMTLNINSDNLVNRLLAIANNHQIIARVQLLFTNQQSFEQSLIEERLKIIELSQINKKNIQDECQQLQSQAPNNMAKYQIYENLKMQENQTTLQHLGVIGFFPTQNISHIKLQIKILECLFPSE
ncbi:hypothetical protein PPL_03009 [Heterostelium album PN500]|uniref:Uncharacterized protein n=1 Tax=Heterostelium pallidum (strain ATCC 26659 / Pp 5 / PN500) TaxID=670386 RepID=D3B3P1_HETP5|nr:hypothetical protein PPL_03009 [Heterostelium album PN500]EFA83939.1 hypothetical protein PPL_03009 [Heterostelium album PN500]|eukprot:XP_020436056.1 hypothetical protein PPL_03009 [Heterostelium album PN500]